jgi:hypothetical protein
MDGKITAGHSLLGNKLWGIIDNFHNKNFVWATQPS